MAADAIDQGTEAEAQTEMTCMNLQTQLSKPISYGEVYVRSRVQRGRKQKGKPPNGCDEMIKDRGGYPYSQLCSEIESNKAYPLYIYKSRAAALEALAQYQNSAWHATNMKAKGNGAENDIGPCPLAGLHITYLKPGGGYGGSVMCCDCCEMEGKQPVPTERCSWSKRHSWRRFASLNKGGSVDQCAHGRGCTIARYFN